jgi:Uma2 family endonuclease
MSQTAPASLADRTTGSVLLHNISWDTYSAILADAADGTSRLTYDHGLLEIEVPSRHHEQIKRFVGEMVEATLKAAGRDYEPAGSATWREQAALRGLEADECYHIESSARVQGKAELDLTTDPPPDLAIEIDLNPHPIDKLAIYRTLRVPEVWRIRADATCEILRQTVDGSYSSLATSEAVPPINPQIISRYLLLRESLGHSEALRRFTAEVLSKP